MDLKVYTKTALATTCGKEQFIEMLDSFTVEGLAEYELAVALEESCQSKDVLTYNPRVTERSQHRILLDDVATVTVTDG